jgi:hypothetical protein
MVPPKSVDIARAALFLASDDASWITGVVLDVSGGAVMRRGQPSLHGRHGDRAAPGVGEGLGMLLDRRGDHRAAHVAHLRERRPSDPRSKDRDQKIMTIKLISGRMLEQRHEKRTGDGRHTIVTTTVWNDESAFERARNAVPEKLRALGINLVEKMKELKVEIERGVYTRSPY